MVCLFVLKLLREIGQISIALFIYLISAYIIGKDSGKGMTFDQMKVNKLIDQNSIILNKF